MFGYVKCDEAELKIKEYETYKAIYCGLCHNLKHNFYISHFTLSYDLVFLCLMRSYALGEKYEFQKKRCKAHILKKILIASGAPSISFCSDIQIILSYYKIIDEIKDEKIFKRFFYKILLRFYKKKANKTFKSYNIKSELDGHLNDLDKIEKENSGDIDKPSDAFGDFLGTIFSINIDNEITKRVLFDIGFHLGKWIYICDAYDDLKDDIKNNSYNPLKGQINNNDLTSALSYSLNMERTSMRNSFLLLDMYDEGLYNILDNIITYGLAKRQESLFKE